MAKSQLSTDFLIIGAGIIGLATAYELRKRFSDASITILEKEDSVACHASGRNSGVIHAGFYYTADSLKARFTVHGNRLLREYVQQNGLKINECGKLVVAKDESELAGLQELAQRGVANDAGTSLITAEEASAIDPNVQTFQQALWSPTTASVDPMEVCTHLANGLKEQQVEFCYRTQYLGNHKKTARTSTGDIAYGYLINCAGLYADNVARDFDLSTDYVLLPFKGIYLKYSGSQMKLKTHVYPVPNLKNPFLGVHFTVTVDGSIKIGPTAIPALWRENYRGLQNFSFTEFAEALGYQSKLFLFNSFGFRSLAQEEIKKYSRSHFTALAAYMVKEFDAAGFTEWMRPGIRAQLLNKKTLELVQDFVVEQGEDSLHVLNAVSPAFTCAFSFAEYLVELISDSETTAGERYLSGSSRVF